MAEIVHLPPSATPSDIVEVMAEHGAVIVDDFVTAQWLKEFNDSVRTSIDAYTPYDTASPRPWSFWVTTRCD